MVGQTVTQATDADDNAAINAAFNHISHLLPLASNQYFDADANPAQGSRLEKAKGDPDLYVAHSSAGVPFQASEDHLQMVTNTFWSGIIPRYSLYTVVRGAIEAAAWCWWLEDSSITDGERVARALTQRLASIRELHSVGRAADFSAQVKQMKGVAQKCGIPVVPLNRTDPEPYAFGAVRPKLTGLLDKLLPGVSSGTAGMTLGRHTYKTLSARAHATGWALAAGAVPIAKPDSHFTIVYITADVPELLRSLRTAVDLHCGAVLGRLEIAGRAPTEFVRFIRGLIPFLR